MKKFLTVLLIMTSIFYIVECTSLPDAELYDDIKEIAYSWLDDSSKYTIKDYNNGIIEEITINTEHIIATKSGILNIKGYNLYKVIFETDNDKLLGTINVYIEKESLNPIGMDFRE